MAKKQKEELPDYTVADMDVDGMPWRTKRPWQIIPGDPARSAKKHISRAEPEDGESSEKETNPFLMEQEEPYTKEERRSAVWMALKASLAIGSVFVLAAFAFLLFCVKVWLR